METKHLKYFLGWINTAEGESEVLHAQPYPFHRAHGPGTREEEEKPFPNKRNCKQPEHTLARWAARPEHNVFRVAGLPPFKKTHPKPPKPVTKWQNVSLT